MPTETALAHHCPICARAWGQHDGSCCPYPLQAECGRCALERIARTRDPRQRRRAIAALKRAP